MDQEKLREIWAELCFHLSDNVSPSINENVFEQKVLFTLEKLLGWSQFRGEIKVRTSLQIGRQNFITPDIVLYANNNKAAIVMEIKRPAEDLSSPGTFGQLQSYMRQTKADFGILIGNEILICYDGTLSPHADPLLLSKIRFKSDSTEGADFVDIFHRNSFIAGKHEPYLKAHIARLEQQQKINAARERLLSEETSHKLLKLIEGELTDIEMPVLAEIMKGLSIKITYGETSKSMKIMRSAAAISTEFQDSILVCKNKASGKYFIYLDDLTNRNIRVINPDGKRLDLSDDLFEEPKEESVDYLLSYNLLTKVQLEKFKQHVSASPEDADAFIEHDPDRVMIAKTRPVIHSRMGSKSPSPSAYEWSRGVPELSKLSGRVTWRSICDHLSIHVGADSARRALKNWARENRRGWPSIPEP